METEENTRWLNDKIQFSRLLCELVAVVPTHLLNEVAESMDLGISDIKELFSRADKAWERTKKLLEEPEVICEDCGSDNVEYAVWHNPNTEELGETFGTFNYGDNTFCHECDDNKRLLFKGDNPEKFKELREKHLTCFGCGKNGVNHESMWDCKTDMEKDDEEEAPQAS